MTDKENHDVIPEEDHDLVDPESQETDTAEDEAPQGDLAERFEALQQKCDRVAREAKEHEDRALYAMAELENVKRRAVKDVEHAHKFALEKFVNGLLPIVDSLDQALQLEATEDTKAMREGIELTHKMFVETLAKYGVERLYPENESFNPEQHEAMTMQEVEGVEPDTIIAVFQAGYVLNGRIVRPARVVVSK